MGEVLTPAGPGEIEALGHAAVGWVMRLVPAASSRKCLA
jgi:hypothetical protein